MNTPKAAGTPPPRSASRRITRRGAIAAAFAVGAIALLGMAALATEAGVWLLARRNAQSTADAAAYGGMLVMSQRPPLRTVANAEAAAREIAALNGFAPDTATTVTVQSGVWDPVGRTFTAGGTTRNAIRVDITQDQSSGFARLISRAVPQVWGGAIASLVDVGTACTLSIPPPGGGTSQVDGTTVITGATTVNAPDCVIASNAAANRSAYIGQNAGDQLHAAQIRASGECYGCDGVPPEQLPGGFLDYWAPTENPYAHIDDRALNPMTGLTCEAPRYFDANDVEVFRPSGNRPFAWTTIRPPVRTAATPSGSIPAICVDVSPGEDQTLELAPGTYYFNEQSLKMSAPTSRITCPACNVVTGQGVTLVFTGASSNSVGNIQIEGGDFFLVGPGTNNGVPSPTFDGVVIYRDALGAASNSANDTIIINGNANSTLFGAVYTPTSEIQISGNAAMRDPAGVTGGCTAFVAGRITFTGSSELDISACNITGTVVPKIKSVVLVQ